MNRGEREQNVLGTKYAAVSGLCPRQWWVRLPTEKPEGAITAINQVVAAAATAARTLREPLYTHSSFKTKADQAEETPLPDPHQLNHSLQVTPRLSLLHIPCLVALLSCQSRHKNHRLSPCSHDWLRLVTTTTLIIFVEFQVHCKEFQPQGHFRCLLLWSECLELSLVN